MDTIVYPASFLDVPNDERRPMTETETQNLFTAIMSEMNGIEPGDFSTIKNTMPYATIIARLNLVEVDLTRGALLAMLAWSDGSPGDLVMWGYTASHIARTSGKKLITCDDLVNAFPFGIPDDNARMKTWDSQKVPFDKRNSNTSDNYLDMIEYWS